MARISKTLALTDEQLDDLMTSNWNMRIATVGSGGRINLTPMWFGWMNGKIYFTGRGQKIVNLRHHPQANVPVDKNECFPELVGAMFQGTGRVLEDAADADLKEARTVLGAKYARGSASIRLPLPRMHLSAQGLDGTRRRPAGTTRSSRLCRTRGKASCAPGSPSG